MATHQEMVDLFREELKLCEVKPSETISVLSAGDSLPEYRKAFVQAVGELGASVKDVNVAGTGAGDDPDDRLKDFGKNSLGRDAKAMATLKGSDMVVDLFVCSFSPEGEEIQAAGARVLLVCEKFETLTRLFPTPDHRRRTEAAAKRIANAKTFRFTNDAGSDVTYRFNGKYRPLIEYGYNPDPGRWDHFPAGLVANFTEDVEGRVVMNEGDIVYPQLQFLTEQVEFEIKGGQVTAIKGGREAAEIKNWMESYKDPRAFAVSHIGWGTHIAAEWSAHGIGMDGRSYYGNVLFSLGPNIEFGGNNDTACHVDLPMRGCSAWVDGERIIGHGRILTDDMRAAGF